MTLKKGNANTVGAGMTFNVAVGLQKLTNPEATDEKAKEYSMMLADTGKEGRGEATEYSVMLAGTDKEGRRTIVPL